MGLPRRECQGREGPGKESSWAGLIGKQGPLGLSPIPSLSPWACVCQSEKQKAEIPRQGD